MGRPLGENFGHKTLLTVKDVASILNTSPSSVYRLIDARLVPFHRIRSGIRFRSEDIEGYLTECRVEAINE